MFGQLYFEIEINVFLNMGAWPSETTPKLCTLTQGQDKHMSVRILSPKLKIKPIKMTGP